MRVLLDTSPLSDANATRGIGTYTRFLLDRLLLNDQRIEVFQSGAMSETELSDFQANVIHYPYFDFFHSTLPFKFLTKTVVTIHDVIPLIFPKHYNPGIRGRIKLFRQKLALKTVDLIITDSESSKKDIIEFLGVPEKKIRVIYLAANPRLKPLSETVLRSQQRKLNLPAHYLLYVGDINYNKNLVQLIKSLKFIPPHVKLVCVGNNFHPQEIPEWAAIEKQIALSDVAKRVKFIEDVTSNDPDCLTAIYQSAIAYIQPSIYEGFGLPILEAMRCQTPVICAKNSSLPEIAGNFAYYVEKAKAEDFAEAVKNILNWKNKERQDFIKKAGSWEKKFSWEKTAKQTIKVYQELSK
ncbi:MAG: glycosyltransferase family 4 protein [Candidatus Pacebacteria bacterium]|nr:glycosyltransferase family 4 protein [Candidatus Paceibacterota bacterium]